MQLLEQHEDPHHLGIVLYLEQTGEHLNKRKLNQMLLPPSLSSPFSALAPLPTPFSLLPTPVHRRTMQIQLCVSEQAQDVRPPWL